MMVLPRQAVVRCNNRLWHVWDIILDNICLKAEFYGTVIELVSLPQLKIVGLAKLKINFANNNF